MPFVHKSYADAPQCLMETELSSPCLQDKRVSKKPSALISAGGGQARLPRAKPRDIYLRSSAARKRGDLHIFSQPHTITKHT